MTDSQTSTLEVPGAVLTYDVRAAPGATNARPLLLIGSPMAAHGFTTLASQFTDRTVITYDPRGSERSTLAADATQPTHEHHAEDLHRLVSEIGVGPVDVFASSGGAVNGLLWVASHPDDVATLVAHEPPLPNLLPDSAVIEAVSADIHRTYQEQGENYALAKFIAFTSHQGPLPADYPDRPGPDPATYGLPAEDDGSRDNPLFNAIGQPSTVEPDAAALQAAPTRVLLAHGAESAQEMTGRAAIAVAALLGSEPEVFPSHHAGFLGGEYGQHGEPDAFAGKLRDVLA